MPRNDSGILTGQINKYCNHLGLSHNKGQANGWTKQCLSSKEWRAQTRQGSFGIPQSLTAVAEESQTASAVTSDRGQSRSSTIRTPQKIVDAIRDQQRASAVEEESQTAVAASAATSSQQPLTAADEDLRAAIDGQVRTCELSPFSVSHGPGIQ